MTVELGRELLRKVDTEIERQQKAGKSDNEPRFYCGASAIGEECARARWYDYRWASKVHFSGQILRLFDRGHTEEYRVMQWLSMIGVEIRATSKKLGYHEGSDSYVLLDWEDEMVHGSEWLDDVTDVDFHVERAKRLQGIELEQWKFVDESGHFRGHSDGKIRFVPGQEQYVPFDEWIGFECKTHGSKSFAELCGGDKDRKAWLKATPGSLDFPGKKVAGSKPEHVIQSQHYMHHLGMRLTLYAGVNKDTDDIHFEFIQYDPQFHIAGQPIIREVLHSPRHPLRLSSHPSYYKCKMCDHRRTCHYGEPMQKNCRTCVFSYAVEDGKHRCRKWNDAVIPKEAQLKGCDAWVEIKD